MSITMFKKALLATFVAALIAVPGLLADTLEGDASAQTQPKPAPKKPAPKKTGADAGAPKKTTSTKDAGSPSVASADAGGAGNLAGDASVPSGQTLIATSDGGTEIAPSLATPTSRKLNPPPPPPSPEQVAALGVLKDEVDAYEKGAKDYRDTVTTIIRLHYESKKKEVLSGLDREIAIEKAELRKARDIAIKRLEEFIVVYSGPRSQPEATPDAMYRLAALYEERARSEDATQPVEVGLKDAIALYKRVIREYPKYREIAGIYYFLGHALNDSGRVPEAMQVWRSLVCNNHYEYPVPVDPKDATKDTIKPMPQDHDDPFWTAWRNRFRDPKSVSHKNPDTTFTDPFFYDSKTSACQYIAQPALRQGEDPKYVAEIWWQLGNWEFDQLDTASGVTKEDPGSVWGYNRAASAYLQSMKYKKPPLYGVALYKYAWTLFKQQRYEAATKQFIVLLNYTDDQQKVTGDTGADFRNEAYTYIAGSLTNVDFKGPEDWEPFIGRPDILDTEPRPDVAEKKLHIAIDRVKDPNLIPQDKPWTIEIYRSLALEYRSLNQFHNAVEVYELMLAKWPMDPTAPDTQNSIAETYDQLNITQRPGTPEHDATAQKALEARTKLANYIGNTPWVDANKDNPAAIQNAERLVRGGLRQAAAQHTNNGKAALVAAGDTTDPGRQLELLSRGATEYKLAAIGWFGYLKQDENAPDAYESRYWLADARREYVRIAVVLHKAAPKTYPEPAKKDIDEALAAATDVRDSNEDDKYLDNAAFFVVDVSDVDRDLAYQRSADGTPGGVEQRQEVKFDSPDEATRKPVRDALPAVVLQSMTARDEYVKIVPPSLDVQHRSNDYAYYVGEQYFLYGQFAEARARFEPMWKDHCGKDELGYKAWEKLITMSNLERDAQRSIQLAEAEKAHSCAFTPEQSGKAGSIINPTIQEAGFLRAREQFEKACEAKIGQKCKNPDAPEKRDTWRKAGELYEAALAAAPGRDEAPEAAMNAAYAYKQIGEYNKAISLYNLFISDYGSEDRLNGLQKGDPKTKAAADPKKYQERIGYLGDAYAALGETYYSFFNYQKAAETYDKVAANERFPEQRRRDNAKNAMILYSNLGQRDKMIADYRILLKENPSTDDKASADYTIASYDFKQWSPTAGDTGSNRQQRFGAESALMTYYQQQKAAPGAAKYIVEAAYNVSKMKRSASDPAYRQWLKSTVAAWDNYRSKAPTKDNVSEAQQSPYVDYAAEADYVLVDEQIAASYDVPSRHQYGRSVNDIFGEVSSGKDGKPIIGADGKAVMKKKGRYQANAAEADKWDQQLDAIAKKYQSLEWVPTAIARQGSLYDTLRTGLYVMVLKNDELFTAQQRATLKAMHDSGRPDLDDKANALEDATQDFWRQKKQQELDGADQVMVKRYATSVALARKYNVKNAQTTRAVSRLSYYTDVISGGDAKMAEYVTSTPDPTNKGQTKLTYSPRQYVQTRPGLSALPPAQGAAAALPAAP